MHTTVERKPLPLPGGRDKVLLHSCCVPCSGEAMEAMLASGIDCSIFFYNPNIHPLKEYELRKHENIRFAEKFGIPFVEAGYDRDNWFERAKGMENEPGVCAEHRHIGRSHHAPLLVRPHVKPSHRAFRAPRRQALRPAPGCPSMTHPRQQTRYGLTAEFRKA